MSPDGGTGLRHAEFGRMVGGGANQDIGLSAGRLRYARHYAEIRYFNPAFGTHNHVMGAQIAVRLSHAMRVLQRLPHRAGHLDRDRQGEGRNAANPLLEIDAAHKFHNRERRTPSSSLRS